MVFKEHNDSKIILPEIIQSAKYDVVFCVKYNRRIFRDKRLKDSVYEGFKIAEAKYGIVDGNYNFAIDSCTVYEGYVKLSLLVDVKYGVYKAVSKLKRESVRILKEVDPSLEGRLPSVWTTKTFFRAVGEKMTEEEVERYVNSQK